MSTQEKNQSSPGAGPAPTESNDSVFGFMSKTENASEVQDPVVESKQVETETETSVEDTPDTKDPVKFPDSFKSDDEEAANQNLSMNDFLKGRGKEILPAINKDAAKQVEQKQVQQRDMTGIEESDVPLFRKMSNDAFEKLKPIYLERKQLNEQLAASKKEIEAARAQSSHPSLYQHPQGYVLDKDFQSLVSNRNTVQQLVNHWEEQLVKIRRGEDWQDLIWDENSKQYNLSQPKPADAVAEVRVMREFSGLNQKYNQFQAQVDNYVNTFNAKQQNVNNFVKEVETKYFADFDKPEHPTYKIQEQLKQHFEGLFSGNPLLPLVYKLAAVNIYNQNVAKAQTAEAKRTEAVKQDARLAPPSAKNFKTGAPNGQLAGISMSAFRDRRAAAD